MRWIGLIIFCAVLLATWAEPDPKKYKAEVKDRNKTSNASLTDEERKFLRDVEAKFGVKDKVPKDKIKIDIKGNINSNGTVKAPFPAVIAIEIVNDTDTNTKGKRTIDANLGYGYRTNNGYTYTYFGKPQEKGKFMIYPYSQEDIPPARPTTYNHGSSGTHSTISTSVEIQPSRAYELVDVKDEQNSYNYNKPTPSPHNNYQNIKGLVSPPPPYSSSESHQESPQTHPSTLYTTYNGHDFSALSGKFPTVMSNYLVDSSQLLKYPQYQNAGLNQDYVKTHSSQLDQRVVPVLVLRVPSSYLKQPTAELYSNLPSNYPVSHYLNNVNLQEIVNNYFKKIGYSFAPQVMTYQNSLLSEPAPTPAVAGHDQHNYANPQVSQPSYTQAHHSGVQYSAVQPVMAKYPTMYTSKEQYYVPMTPSHYQQPEQQYEYTYQYTPQSEQGQAYYVPQYQSQSAEVSQETRSEHGTAEQSSGGHGVPQQAAAYETSEPAVEYGTPEPQTLHHASSAASQYEAPQATSQEYGAPKEQTVEYVPQHTVASEYGSKYQVPAFSSSQGGPRYEPTHHTPKETLVIYSQMSQAMANYAGSGSPSYYYQKQAGDDTDSSNSLVLSENYPSKDHTIATVLPLSYKRDKKPNTGTGSVQTVSYVTPVPYSSKYQSPYKIMVPQTVLRNPSAEKVSYVNSHSIPYSQLVNQEYNPEAEYKLSSQYIPPVGKQKAPSYPRNYHSHPKRNAKPEKSDSRSSQLKKRKENNDHKKSS